MTSAIHLNAGGTPAPQRADSDRKSSRRLLQGSKRGPAPDWRVVSGPGREKRCPAELRTGEGQFRRHNDVANPFVISSLAKVMPSPDNLNSSGKKTQTTDFMNFEPIHAI